MPDSIEDAMKKDHGKLTSLLLAVDKKKDRPWEELEKDFNEFKFELEKHFVTEEKAIFTFIDNDTPECNAYLSDLLSDHKYIRKVVKTLESDLYAGHPQGLDGFMMVLNQHRDFEDEVFYPLLDKELSDEQKRQVLLGINSPIN